MDGVGASRYNERALWANSQPRPVVEQNQAQNQAPRRTANKGKNEEAFAADGATTRRPLFEARAKSTNGMRLSIIYYMNPC